MGKNSSDSSNAWLLLITNQHHHKTAHLPATLQTLSLILWPIFSPPVRILLRCSVLSFVQCVPILLLSKIAFDKGVCQCFWAPLGITEFLVVFCFPPPSGLQRSLLYCSLSLNQLTPRYLSLFFLLSICWRYKVVICWYYKALKSLETVVNTELKNVCDWLNANTITINVKKSNFVVFRPRQKKELIVRHASEFRIITIPSLLREEILGSANWRESNLEASYWLYFASKISKIVGTLAWLRHHVPLNILLQIYRSLIFPYRP